MKHLPLTNSERPALVDDDIYAQTKDRHWRLVKVTNGAVYIAWKTHRDRKDVNIYLHRLVMGEPKGKMIDHINGDPFDNRRENLRACTNSQNQMNSKGRPHASQYKNVFWSSQLGKWKAQLTVDGKDFFLGYFEKERHAAYAVELSRPILHGEHARSNFTSSEIVAMSLDVPL
jgi:hypothetical protein